MKAIKLCILIIFIFLGHTLFSQVRLTITSLNNFPNALGDSAYAGNSYDSIQITIQNTGNLAFQGEVDVFLLAGPAVLDTLFLDSTGATFLAPGDSITRRPVPYLFNSVHYDDGDNIVVVWPQARTTGIQSDTLSFHVYYVSLQSIGEHERNQILISPNPGTDFIRLVIPEINQVEYVRIFNSEGRLIFVSDENQETIAVRNWPAGLYYLEVQGNKGRYSGRLIIQ